MNSAYVRMYGYASPERMMAEVTDVGRLYAHPEDRGRPCESSPKRASWDPREFEVVRRDGKRIWVEVLAREIRDVSGRLLCYQASPRRYHRAQSGPRRTASHLRFLEFLDRVNRAIQGPMTSIG